MSKEKSKEKREIRRNENQYKMLKRCSEKGDEGGINLTELGDLVYFMAGKKW